MKTTAFLVGILFLVIFVQLSPAADRTQVLCHYMPWFKAEVLPDGQIEWDHWQWYGKGPKHDPDEILDDGRRDIASVHYPVIGPYDGRDEAVLEYHMLTAKAAGIEGFVADWYGPDNYPDQVFAAMTRAADRYGMKVAICLEEKSFFPNYSQAASRAEAQDVMERYMRHVLDTHAKSDAYLRHDGRAVFYIFNGHEQTSLGLNIFSPEELGEVLGRFEEGEVFYVRGDAEPKYMSVVDGCYLWIWDVKGRTKFYTNAKAARDREEIDYWVGMANPGFDDSGVHGWGNGPRVDERSGTRTYEEMWGEVVERRPDAIQVATWNDFQEGTTIEPTMEYGFTFVDLTEEYVARYTGRASNTGDNAWPHRIYKLRMILRDVEDADARAKWTARLDAFADAFADGKRTAMGIKLWWYELRINGLSTHD